MNPILIHKSDSTIFANINKFLTFNLETELDLTGWQAKFILGWVEKTIDDISSHSFEIILGAQDTKQLRLGKQYGTIILTDSNGNVKTVTNTIPFEVTTAVVENEYQEIDLTIPESSGVDIKLKVGASYVTSVNGMTGDVYLTIPSIEGLATEQQLAQGLNTKQDKGDYALVEDIPTLVSELENDSNFATQTQVLQAIASIPQFKMSIVDELPLAGEKMTLYLVPKEGTNNNVYDEYIWIEQTSSFEHLGTTAVDLTDYVKNTDYANSSTGGVVRIQNGSHGLIVSSYGVLTIYKATEAQITGKSSDHAPLVTKNIDLVVKTGVTTNTIELTEDEKTTACNWLGTAKTVLTTEADYNALETKEANTLYLIEE